MESCDHAETLLSRLLSLNEETTITKEKFLDLSGSLDIPSHELEIIFNALDLNGDGGMDVSDAIILLTHAVVGGPPPVQGVDCIVVPFCPGPCMP